LSAIFSERAHQAALVVGVFEAIEKHVVENATVAHAIAGARAIKEVRRVGHTLHTSGDGDGEAACEELVVGEHDGLHAGAAHFVDGGCGGGNRKSRGDGGLARGSLALAGRKHAAHDGFVDGVGWDASAGDCGADGDGAEFRRSEVFEIALKRADGGAGRADDDDGIV
jgi:hypothetical protein